MTFRKLGQSRLLDSLSKSYDKKGRDTTGRGRQDKLVVFDDNDPYKFVDSQSFEVVGDKCGDLVKSKIHTFPVQKPPKSFRIAASASKLAINNNADTTPVSPTDRNKSSVSSQSGKMRKSPAALTEKERLQIQENNDLKRAMEASLSVKGREERQRKRNLRDSHVRDQRTMEKLQRDLEKTINLVDAAKDLNKNCLKLTTEERESDFESEHVVPTALTSRPSPSVPFPPKPAICRGDASSPIIISEGGSDEVTPSKEQPILDVPSNSTPLPTFPLLLASTTPRVNSPQLKSVFVKRLDLNKGSAKRSKWFAAVDTVQGEVTTPPPRKANRSSDGDTTPTLGGCPSDRRQPTTSDCRTSSASHRKEPMDGCHVHITPIWRSKKGGDNGRHSASSVARERTPPISGVVRGGLEMPNTPPLGDVRCVSEVVESESLLPKNIKRNLFQSRDKAQKRDLPPRKVSNTPPSKRPSGLDKREPSVISVLSESDCQSPSHVDGHKAKSVNDSSVRAHKVGFLSLKKVGNIPAFTSLTQHSDLTESTGSLSPRGAQRSSHGNDISLRKRTMDAETVAPDATEMATEMSPLGRTKRPRLVRQNISDGSSDGERIRLDGGPKSKMSPSSTGHVKGDSTRNTRQLRARPSALLSPMESTKHLRTHPSTLLNAHGDTSPEDYSKTILGSLDGYLSQLAVAQSKVVYRVRWGKPIMSSSKPSHDYLMSVKRSDCSPDNHSKYTLKIDHNYRSVTPDGPRMQASQTVRDAGEDCILDECLGVVQTPDVIAADRERDEVVDGSLAPAEASPGHLGDDDCADDCAEDGDGFIPLYSYSEEGEESLLRDSAHECGETDLHATQNGACEEENAERLGSRNSGRGTQENGRASILVEQEHLSGAEELPELPEGAHEVIQIGTQDTVAGSSPGTFKTSPADILELAGGSTAVGGSRLLSSLRRRTGKLRSKDVLRAHKPQDSEESDGMTSEIASRWLRSDSDVELRDSPSLREEDSLWLNSRKQPKMSTSSSKRLSISKQSASTSKKSAVMKTGGAETPRNRKRGSAAARLFSRGTDAKENPLSKSGVSSLAVVEDDSHALQKADRAQLRRPFRSLIDSSDSEERSGALCPLKHGPREVAAGRAKDECCSPIDLTEEPDRRYDSKQEVPRPSEGGRVCPMCGQTFDEADIQLHADACLDAKHNKEKCLLQCTICKGMFPSSLIAIHTEQCGRDSSDDNLPWRKRAPQQLTLRDLRHGDSNGNLPAKRKSTERMKVTFGRSGAGTTKKKEPQLLSSRHLRHTTSQDIETDSENGDVIDVSDQCHLQGRLSSTSSPPLRVTDAVQPQAIPCEDGGYIIDPSSISTSPIRSFTRLQDLDPDQRAHYQNQFQAKARRPRGGKSAMPLSKGKCPNKFDELLVTTTGCAPTGLERKESRGGWGRDGRGGRGSGHRKVKRYNWKHKNRHGWKKQF